MLPPLTPLEKRVVDTLETRLRQEAISPSNDELCQAIGLTRGYRINRLLNSLEEKGYLTRKRGRARSLRLLARSCGRPIARHSAPAVVEIPVLGLIAAGHPIDPQDGFDETISLTAGLVGDPSNTFALRVKGDSMVGDSVLDGDLVILRHQNVADNGDLVAVWLRDPGETTLKRFYREGRRVRLRPANPKYTDRVEDARNVLVQGKVVAVIRQVA